MKTVLRSVLASITPSEKENHHILQTIERVRAAVNEHSPHPHILAGSYTRGTWMKDKREVDVFVLFPPSTRREVLEKKGLEIGKRVAKALKGKAVIAYAEHPYTRISFGSFAVDIVPAYKVDDPQHIQSAVDRTPFHNQYLEQHFYPELAAEARLLKQFLKANGLYGSDSKTSGFSGYLCELLILHFKSFQTLVKRAARWQPGTYVDTEGHHPVAPPFPHALIVIDPIDPKRNVAAVLTPENFVWFVSLCKRFVKKPTAEFFSLKQRMDRSVARVMRQRGTTFLGMKITRPEILDDILYPQLRRTLKRVGSMLNEQDFVVQGSGVECDERACYLVLELEVASLPPLRKVVGPPFREAKHARDFLKKYHATRTFVEDGRWVAEIPRKWTEAHQVLRALLKHPKKRLQELGVAGEIAGAMKKQAGILSQSQILSATQKPSVNQFFQQYLFRQTELPIY